MKLSLTEILVDTPVFVLPIIIPTSLGLGDQNIELTLANNCISLFLAGKNGIETLQVNRLSFLKKQNF